MNLKDDYLHVSFREEVFRVSFLQPFMLIFTLSLLVTELTFFFAGTGNRLVAFIILPAILTVLCSIAVFLMQVRYKFGMGPDGIQCYDYLCHPCQTSWDDVDDIRLVSTAGLDYLQVITRNNSRAIWIPLFVKRYTCLRRMMMVYTRRTFSVHQKLTKLLS